MLWLLRGFGDEEVFVSSVEKKSVRVGNGERLGIGGNWDNGSLSHSPFLSR